MFKLKNIIKQEYFKSFFLFAFIFLYSLSLFARTVIISDIDDTLKQSNSMGGAAAQTYHFLRKIPYTHMRDFFNELKAYEKENSEVTHFYYVSAAYSFTFNAQIWLNKNHFPSGRSVLKNLKSKGSIYQFKYEKIKEILMQEMQALNKNENEVLTVFMFGDNAQFDAVVYSDLTKELNLNSSIYIRDVRAEATFFDSSIPVKKLEGIKYYFSERELFLNPEFSFISSELKLKTNESYIMHSLIPMYTLKTLSKRLNSLYNDKPRANVDATKFWNDYYNRF